MKKGKQKQSNAEKILRQIEKLAQQESLPIVGPDRGKILADEVRKAKPRHVLEVGTLVGYSAILMGKELDEDAEVVTVEINRDAAKAAKENVEKADISPKVTIILGNAVEVIPALNGPFDFAFIDAKKNEYLKYLKLAEDKFQRGTVVVADNVGISGDQMSDYLNYVRNSGNYGSRYVQVEDDGLEISVRI
jgi:predicted O-methyltransferase YrrM